MTAVPVANPLFEPGRGQPWIGYPEFAVQSLQLGSTRFSYQRSRPYCGLPVSADLGYNPHSQQHPP